jgi:4-hydroxy-tetrahydrodipicolinate reductase
MAITRIAIIGAAGRMGRAIARAILEGKTAEVVAAVERPGAPELGQDLGPLAGIPPLGVTVLEQLPAAGAADVWIDFTAPASTVANVRAAQAAGARIVVGTTGLSPEDRQVIATAAAAIPVVLAPNTSLGVTVLLKLVADAARALGPGYDIEVVEAHHRLKRDAPSGTALRLAEAAAEGSNRNLAETARYARHGDIGPPHRRGDRHPDHPRRRRDRGPHRLLPGPGRAGGDHPPGLLARHLRPRCRPRRRVASREASGPVRHARRAGADLGAFCYPRPMGRRIEKKSPATWDDLEAAPEHLMAELIDGTLYLSPRPGLPHQRAAGELLNDLVGPFDRGRGGPGGWIIVVEPQLRLGGNGYAPDLAGWRRERLPQLPNVAAVELAPDWICEVRSPSTAPFDRKIKMPKYAAAGVTWFWIVDPEAEMVEAFRVEGGAYLSIGVYSEDDKVRIEPFAAVELDLAALWRK